MSTSSSTTATFVVPPDYLRRVMAPFADAKVGMVTTLYRAVAGSTLGSKLEALGLSTDFAGGVLLARAMEGGIRFGLGATMATTKAVLREDRRPRAAGRLSGRRLRARCADRRRRLHRGAGGPGGRDRPAGLQLSRVLASPDALGAKRERPPARPVFRPDRDVRIAWAILAVWRGRSAGGPG